MPGGAPGLASETCDGEGGDLWVLPKNICLSGGWEVGGGYWGQEGMPAYLFSSLLRCGALAPPLWVGGREAAGEGGTGPGPPARALPTLAFAVSRDNQLP